MSFTKVCTDELDELSLTTLNNILETKIDKKIKLVLIFSTSFCKPCNDLTNVLDEIYKNIQNNQLPRILKFNVDEINLNDLDTQHIKKYPTILIFEPNELELFNDNESLVNQCFINYDTNLQKGTIMIGNINKFLDNNVTAIDF